MSELIRSSNIVNINDQRFKVLDEFVYMGVLRADTDY